MNTNRRLPVVTLILIAANIIAAFAMLFSPDVQLEFGFRPSNPSLWNALTSLFLHANVLHLLGNMVFLAAVGAAVELATGSIRFASVYFVSGLVGVATHAVLSHGSATPYVGASGCIAGCAAYYSVRYTSMRVPIAPKVALSVAAITGVWVVLQIVGAFVSIGQAAGTAFWAHLGGFAAGALLSLVFRTPDLGHIKLGHEVLEKMNERGPVALVEAAKRHLLTHPNDPKALGDLAKAYALLDDKTAEVDTLIKLFENGAEEDQPGFLARLVELGAASRLSSHRRIGLAEKYRGTHPSVARILLKSVIEGSANDTQRPEAMLSLIGLERESQPELAKALLDELIQSYPLHPCVELARKRGWAS